MSRLLILGQGWLPEQASTSAKTVDFAFAFVTWISAFFFILIVGLMVVFAIRYRRRKEGEAGEGAHHHLGIELVWTGIPILVVAAIFWVGLVSWIDLQTPPSQTYDVQVTAQKWSWLFQYPNGWSDSELHVPVNQPVKIVARSQDVLHSFYIPAFRVKQDVVPGRLARVWFNANRVGDYPIFCTEYCGTGHSDMLSRVIVHEPGGFEKWMREASSLLSPRFRETDVVDSQALAIRLKGGDRAIDEHVRSQLLDGAREGLSSFTPAGGVSKELLAALIESLNRIMEDPELFTEERFAGVEIGDATRAELEQPLEGEDLLYRNRHLLAEAYPDGLARDLDFVSVGRKLFETKGGCASCHTVDGSAKIGPTLKGVFGHEVTLADGGTVTADEEYLRESIENPRAKTVAGFPAGTMPPSRMSARENLAVIEYIKSLSDTE